MLKFLLLDCDGIVIKRDKYFSQRLAEQAGVKLDIQKISEFFRGVFLECETGKKDLKEELARTVADWGWQGSIEELLGFWFEGERTLDAQVVDYIRKLRAAGLKVYISTDQEKYRARDLWETAGIKTFADGMLSSSDLGFLKSDVGYWQAVQKTLPNHEKNQVLFWDHEAHKLEAAKKFGYLAEKYQDFETFKQTMESYL